jgi:electron transport complex protein RnfG
MKKLESTWYNMAIVLTVISVVAGAALAYVNELTKGPIAEIQQRNEAQAIKTVLCDENAMITDTISNGDVVLYLTDNGAAVKTTDPLNGSFGGGLTIMVGLNKDFQVLGYTVLLSNETPGLGAKADEWFQKGGKGEIVGRTAGQLATTKDNGEIDAITASTITTRSFLRAVNNAYAEYAKVVNPHAEADVHTSATAKDMN